MKSFFKGVFGGSASKPTGRELSHPRDLNLGDMIQLSDSFGLPPRLRAYPFKVVGITTQQFEHEYSTTFSLEGQDSDTIDLTIEGSGARSEAAFSLTIERDQVEQIFDLDQFATIFDGEEPAEVAVVNKLDLDYWLADTYHQNAAGERGYFYPKDYRPGGPPTVEGEGEPFDFFSLASPDGSQGVEIEVYEGGETDVCLVLYRPVTDIKELWPAG